MTRQNQTKTGFDQKKTGVWTDRPQNQRKTEKNRLYFFASLVTHYHKKVNGPKLLTHDNLAEIKFPKLNPVNA